MNFRIEFRRLLSTGVSVIIMLTQIVSPMPALADHTSDPASVTVVGSLQSEAGCAGDWDPACSTTYLTYDGDDGVWQGMWNISAGDYEYKAALNYGATGTQTVDDVIPNWRNVDPCGN